MIFSKKSKCFISVFFTFFSFSCFAQQLVIPSYFYPDLPNCGANNTCYWQQLNESSQAVGIALINPDNGVGFNIDSNFLEQTKASQGKGIKVLGYVMS